MHSSEYNGIEMYVCAWIPDVVLIALVSKVILLQTLHVVCREKFAKNSRNIREKFAKYLRNICEIFAKYSWKICKNFAKNLQKIKICEK